MTLFDCWLEVTSRCNSKCITCNMWKEIRSNELSLEEIKNILKSECLRTIHNIYLTGGEPFLRDDLVDIVNFISSEIKCSVGITTNGLLPYKIYKMVSEMKLRPHIDISLNGREEIHDFTRGIKGSFKKAIETYEYLLKLGFNAPFLFTICPYNIEEIQWIKTYSKKLETSVNYALARPVERIKSENLDIYTYSKDQKERILSQLPPSNFKNVIEKHFNGTLRFSCKYGSRAIDISSTGYVYPCSHYIPAMKMGSLRETSLDKIVSSKRSQEIVKMIQNYKCQPCSTSLSHACNSMSWGNSYLIRRKIKKMIRFKNKALKYIFKRVHTIKGKEK